MRTASSPAGPFTDVDFAADGVCRLKVTVSLNAPRRFEFSYLTQGHQETPIAWGTWVEFSDANYGVVFEGFVTDIKPGDNFGIDYVAHDPTWRVGQEIFVQSGPESNVNRYPRGVWNAEIEGDDDFAFARSILIDLALVPLIQQAAFTPDEINRTVGQIAAEILDDDPTALAAFGATPASGVDPPYDNADISVLDAVPQEKQVFDSETIPGAIDRLFAWYPNRRLVFEPGPFARKWRFRDVFAAPSITRTINDAATDHPIISFDIDRSLENRFTAVKILGPQVVSNARVDVLGNGTVNDPFLDAGGYVVNTSSPTATVFRGDDTLDANDDTYNAQSLVFLTGAAAGQVRTVLDYTGSTPRREFTMSSAFTETPKAGDQFAVGTLLTSQGLTPLWDTASAEAIFTANGPRPPVTSDVSRVWQIADPAKRRIARQLSVGYLAQVASGLKPVFVETWAPTLEVTFDDGESWMSCRNITIDYYSGIIYSSFQIYQLNAAGLPQLPDNVRFTFGYQGAPLSVRRPAAGFEGTASAAPYSIEKEMRLADEALAVGFVRNVPITTAGRQAEFEKAAQAILDAHKDVVYMGGCVLQGADYDFINLNRRINFAGVDSAGAPLTTNWESIGAVVSEAEYDYSNDKGVLTTIVFSADALEFANVDIDALKVALKFKTRELFEFQDSSFFFGFGGTIRAAVGQRLVEVVR
jgi:hypothetical protein